MTTVAIKQVTEAKPAAAFAAELEDAYSTGRYDGGVWLGCICALRDMGLDDRAIEAIIRSKWTRWAADESSHPDGHATARDLAGFVQKQGARAIAKLTAEHWK